MKSTSPSFVQRAITALSLGTLDAWLIALSVTLVLSVIRVMQIAYLWPAGLDVSGAEVFTAALQGARFDLKVSAAAVVLLLPLLFVLPQRFQGWVGAAIATVLVAASLVNVHYFGFYKTPIDPVVFGFLEDDTQAIVQTIWRDFPVWSTLLALVLLSGAAIMLRKRLYTRLAPRLLQWRLPAWQALLAVALALFVLVFSIKGTLRAMALERQNISVTTSQFLNDMVPNGAIAFSFAWDNRQDSQNFSDPLVGLKNLGFGSPMEAARQLGLQADNEKNLRQSLFVQDAAQAITPKKNLLFFMMESWSAEPFLYHAKDFDVLGRLAPVMGSACHFSNFDSAQTSTHPSLEAILFASPITPLTLGSQGKRPIPWSVAQTMRNAGYRTVFLTSSPAGWRDLDRVLKIQGFDEVVDAAQLRALYPDATMGIWGVWDSYVFKYLSQRLEKPVDNKPLFVFTLTSTNHPPYELPSEYQRLERNMDKWHGERESASLSLNLDTYHYATDLLGALVQQVQSSTLRQNTIIAATGDHNVRSFGTYATPQRRYLASQVPFIIWGDSVNCGSQRQQPASHRDMFPTLFPLAGIYGGYLNTGRNLLADPGRDPNPALSAPHSVSYTGIARNAKGSWALGNPASFVCTHANLQTNAACVFDAQADTQERARLALLDWNVRSVLK
jgi:phosphoglycerol transferase MdoB-like AlkP superfamily enzyme